MENGRKRVDIGTEWNLKFITLHRTRRTRSVDIGTEWNLKECESIHTKDFVVVDIGTEWNLKTIRKSLLTEIVGLI